MADKKAENFKTAIKQAIEDIFTKLENIISKQCISIESIINNGALIQYEKKRVAFSHTFSDLFVQKYYSTEKAGVLLSLTVKYSLKGAALFADYTETAAGLNIQMKYIPESGETTGFHISKDLITKAQFIKFLRDTGQKLSTIIPDERLRSKFKIYPDDYHMPKTYITKQKAKEFTAWLNKKSYLKYRLPTREEGKAALKKR